jgi:hypothetical protein
MALKSATPMAAAIATDRAAKGRTEFAARRPGALA